MPRQSAPSPRRPARHLTALPPSTDPRRPLARDERRALALIVALADVELRDGAPMLVVPADPRLLDALAAFDAELEDLEPAADDEPDDDNEHPLATIAGGAA